MAALDQLEEQLNDVFVKKAPFQIPDEARKTIVNILPWLNLIFGAILLLSALGLYNAAKAVDQWVDYANTIARTYGSAYTQQVNELSWIVWLGIIMLAIEGALWLISFPSVRAKKKSGWNILFIALLINIVYGLLSLFISVGAYGGASGFFGFVISTVVGLYLLFQIRSVFLPAKKAAASTDKKSESKNDKK